MNKTTKKSKVPLEQFPEPEIPVKGARLIKARKLIKELLVDKNEERTARELFDFIQSATCLTQAEIAAGLRALAQEGSIQFFPQARSQKGCWRLHSRLEGFEAIVSGKRSGQYTVTDVSGENSYELIGTESVPVLPGDRVEVVLCKKNYSNDAEQVEIRKLLKRTKRDWVCYLVQRVPDTYKDETFFWARPVDPFSPTDFLVRGDVNACRGKAFVVELEDELVHVWTGCNVIVGKLGEVLGEADDPAVEREVAIRRFDLPHVFSNEALSEADSFAKKVLAKDRKGRIDLRDIGFVTIDGEDARDFDDAVWAQNYEDGWRLLVAIADVSFYVKPESALDREAQTRATSVYFPRCVIPMLPEVLSNGLCSLNPNVDRLTVVCDMVINGKGEVTAYQFYRAVICSKARLTYTAVFSALNGDTTDIANRGGNPKDIETLNALFKALRLARERRGAIDFETAEAQILCAENGKIESIQKREHNDAHRIIEECMLAANTCAAHLISHRSLTSLFRVHDAPSADRLDNLRAELAGFGLSLEGGIKPTAKDFEEVLRKVAPGARRDAIVMAMLRTMQQALYSPINVGHYGLNYEAYTHFTSPIRRYPDLLVHRTICAALENKTYTPKVLVDTEWFDSSRGASNAKKGLQAIRLHAQIPETPARLLWERLGLICSAAERRADEASRDVVAWLKCLYAKTLPHKPYPGVVTGVNSAGLYVTLSDVFIEGFVHVSKIGYDYYVFDVGTRRFEGSFDSESFGIGDSVYVEIDSIDMTTRSIDFRIVPEIALKRKSSKKRKQQNEKGTRKKWLKK